MSYRPRLNKYVYEFINHYKNSNVVGIISDTHFPFQHKNYLPFIYETFNKFQVKKILHIGDLVDGNSWSYWESGGEADNPAKEAALAQKEIDILFKTFPEGEHIMGNHDALITRKAKSHNIPTKFLKTFEDIWSFPNGWKSQYHIEIDDVLYIHGTGKSGLYSSVGLMTDYRQSVVSGHTHSSGGVNYRASYKDLTFALNVGCLIDVDTLAMEYGRHFSKKPTLGCGIVIDGKMGFFIPMDLGSKINYKH